MHGATEFIGGRGWDNITTAHSAVAGKDLNVSLTPTAVVESLHATHRRSVAFSGIERRTHTINGAAGSIVRTSLTQPLTGTNVLLNSNGAAGGEIHHKLRMCQAGAFVRFQVAGPGMHSLDLGNAASLAETGCGIRLVADGHPQQTVALSLSASADPRSIVIRVGPGMVTVEPAGTDASMLTIYHTNVHRLTITPGVGGAVVHHDSGDESTATGDASSLSRTEVVVNMTKPVVPGRRNVVNVTSTLNGLFVTGHVDQVVGGRRHLVTQAAMDPFTQLLSPVVIAPTNRPVVVDGVATVPPTGLDLTSAAGADAPTMRVLVGANHIDRVSADGVVIPPPRAGSVTPWLCEQMQSVGVPSSACDGLHALVYHGGNFHVSITTGDAADELHAVQPLARLRFDMGANADTVYLDDVSRIVEGMLGVGRDSAFVGSMGAKPVVLNMGDDDDMDSVFSYTTAMVFTNDDPAGTGSTTNPSGPLHIMNRRHDSLNQVPTRGSIVGYTAPVMPPPRDTPLTRAAPIVTPPPTPVGSPEIFGQRLVDGSTVYEINDCEGHMFRRLALEGPGQHHIYVGGHAGDLSKLACDVRIHGGNESVTVTYLHVNAANDGRPLAVHGARNQLHVLDRRSGGALFQLSYIKTQYLQFTGGVNSAHLRLLAGTEDMEQVFHLLTPSSTAPVRCVLARVAVCGLAGCSRHAFVAGALSLRTMWTPAPQRATRSCGAHSRRCTPGKRLPATLR